MTPMQQAERALETIVGCFEAADVEGLESHLDRYDLEPLSLRSIVERRLIPARMAATAALAAIRAAQNQPDAGAVVDACEAALREVMDLADDWANASASAAHPLSGHSERKEERQAKEDLGTLISEKLSLIRAYRESQPGPWRLDMASAPRDGTVFLVPGGIAHYYEGVLYTLTGEVYPGRPIQWECWAWMPMPKAPPPAQEGGAA